MSDYADMCREQRTHKARIKSANLKRALAELDDGKWRKHSEHHWSRIIPLGQYNARLDYWPSTDKCRLDDLSGQTETKTGAFAYIKRLIR